MVYGVLQGPVETGAQRSNCKADMHMRHKADTFRNAEPRKATHKPRRVHDPGGELAVPNWGLAVLWTRGAGMTSEQRPGQRVHSSKHEMRFCCSQSLALRLSASAPPRVYHDSSTFGGLCYSLGFPHRETSDGGLTV